MFRPSLKKRSGATVGQRRSVLRGAALTGLSLLAAICTGHSAKAQFGNAPGGFQSQETVGMTLYQVSGFTGVIYLKKVPQITGTGDYIGDKLDYIGSMNTQMKWLVKYNLPPGNQFVNLSISAHSQGANVSPATADSWDGKTMIDKASIAPWSMSRILQQCEQQLANPDGSYKSTAEFDLQPGVSERVLAQGFSKHPNAPAGSTQKHSASGYPQTRVKVYVLDVRAAQTRRTSGFSTHERQVMGINSAQNPNRVPNRFPNRIPTTRPQTNLPQGPATSNLVPFRRPTTTSTRRPVVPTTQVPPSRFPTTRVPATRVPTTRVPNLSSRLTRDIPVQKQKETQTNRRSIGQKKGRVFGQR